MSISSPVIAAPSLADFTAHGLIAPELAGSDSASVIQELSRRLLVEGRIPDLLPFYNAVLNREFLVNTAMEHGMAFPHARLGIVGELCFAFGKATRPLAWGPAGTAPVDLVFLIAVPATEATNYINLISGLARLAKESRILEQLRASRRVDDILAVLGQVPLRHSHGAKS